MHRTCLAPLVAPLALLGCGTSAFTSTDDRVIQSPATCADLGQRRIAGFSFNGQDGLNTFACASPDGGFGPSFIRPLSVVNTPLVPGSRGTQIEVVTSCDLSVSVASVASSDAAVADFGLAWVTENGQAFVDVTANEPGTADLILRNGAGHEFDRVTLTVEAPVEIAPLDDPSLAFFAGIDGAWDFTAGLGQLAYVGASAMAFTFSGSLAASPHPVATSDLRHATAQFITLPPAGQGTIHAALGDTHADLSIRVVDGSAVTRVDPRGGVVGRSPALWLPAVYAGASTVLGAPFSFSSEPIGLTVTLASSTVRSASNFPPTDVYQVRGAPGSYVLTGTLSGSAVTVVTNVTIEGQ